MTSPTVTGLHFVSTNTVTSCGNLLNLQQVMHQVTSFTCLVEADRKTSPEPELNIFIVWIKNTRHQPVSSLLLDAELPEGHLSSFSLLAMHLS